ncbi:hypothetical protein U14_05429 [Candidatus Moduliflexus flocculans]|uniref:PA14 domain-containing protein n=1 Tax=Candidatus Moduliflexus flocculans TaxID=1499966 RepID=A0A081BRX0_9BACT|nr:hypothetical protein U14_05429 [Candidatus Moduliflexus flocculans]
MITMKNSRTLNTVFAYLLLFSAVFLVVLWSCRPPLYGLTGYYYDNTTWTAPAYATHVDTDFSTETLKAIRKKLPQNIYSVEWKGYFVAPETGWYTFSTESDDGSLVHIGDAMVVENGGPHGLQQREGKIHLLKGVHPFRIRFEQHGGFAAINVLYGRVPLSGMPLDVKLLLPEGTSLERFWMYRQATTALPYLLGFWGMALIWLFIASFREFRAARKLMFARHAHPSAGVFELLGVTLHRAIVQPLVFTGENLRRPDAYFWAIVAIYSSIIFVTLSYARQFSTFMMERFGNDIFSRITVVTLLVVAVFLLLYLLRVKTHLVSRFIAFAGIVALYAFFLHEPLRENIYAALRWVGLNTAFFEALEIFPIYAGEKIHFLEYGFLGLLLCKTLSYRLKDRSAYWLALLIVYLIGMTDEGIQWALPSRVGEYRDIWMNITSGGLAILSVFLVIRPRAFQGRFSLSSLRPICYTLAAAIVYTGIFLQSVHGFGHKIFMPDNGAEFVSSFAENELIALDRRIMERYENKPVEDIPYLTVERYNYEAGRHHYLRNKYNQNGRYFESYCEQEIIKTYYRSALRKGAIQLFEYKPETFQVTPDPNEFIFYRSAGHELAILAFSQRVMWATIGISAAFLCLFATMIPISKEARTHFGSPRVRRDGRRFETFVLRPLFFIALLAMLGANIYISAHVEKPQYTNLLILTVDSAQPDYWSAYGYPKRTTPFAEQLAAQGTIFTNAIAPSSWTIPSLASLMTGVNPNVHGIDIRAKAMDPRIPTLFEVMEQHGYTIGDTSYVMTEPSINTVFKKTEISPEVALSEGRSEESYLLSWMEKHRREPFFAWVHFHTSHLPYRATPPYNKLFLEGIHPDVLQDEQIQFVKNNLIVRKGEVEFDKKRHTDAIRALYAQTLRQQDAKIGKVLMKLDELGLRENTLIVITADHGDELMEHGFVGHASTSWDTTVYDDLINVPMFYVLPGKVPQGKRVDTQVRTIDVMPTVLDLLGIPFDKPIQGKSYASVITDDGEFEETAFSETTPCGYSCPSRLAKNRLRSVRTNDWKFISIYHDDTGQTTEELYNLKEDRGETKNVIAENLAIAGLFREEMQWWMDAPKQFPYQAVATEQEHYLDTDVEVRPIVTFPKVGTVVTPKTYEKRILVSWIGDKNGKYVIEYDVGTGGYHMTGELEAVGTEQWFGPFPEDIWQALPLYNPWRFRVIPKDYPQYPSEWITFEMKNE